MRFFQIHPTRSNDHSLYEMSLLGLALKNLRSAEHNMLALKVVRKVDSVLVRYRYLRAKSCREYFVPKPPYNLGSEKKPHECSFNLVLGKVGQSLP